MFSTPIIPRSNRATALVAALGVAFLIVAYFEVRPHGPHGPGPAMRDFEAFYAAGVAANHGSDPYGRAIWDAEKTIPGVDASHDETLPFVGLPAGLPVWRALARLPYDVAGRIWGACLALSMLVLLFGSLALARAPKTAPVLLGATILAAASGSLISDVSLGQLALVCAAAVVAALLLLSSRAWLLAALAAAVTALAPNLAIVLLARLTDRRSLVAFAVGALGIAVLTLPGEGVSSIARYLHLLSVHGAAEVATVIQITPSALALGFGINAATLTRIFFAVLAIGLTIVALRGLRDAAVRVGIASCALPFAVPFIHEHDFVLLLLPAIVCAVRARGATLAFAAVAATATGIDWLGLAQRPHSDPQMVVLSVACALGFVLVAGLRPQAFAALSVPVAVAAVCLLARAHPVPIWPDALPPHWQPPPGASVSMVWELEQRVAGLAARNPVWDLLRALALASCAMLGFATYLTAVIPSGAARSLAAASVDGDEGRRSRGTATV